MKAKKETPQVSKKVSKKTSQLETKPALTSESKQKTQQVAEKKAAGAEKSLLNTVSKVSKTSKTKKTSKTDKTDMIHLFTPEFLTNAEFRGYFNQFPTIPFMLDADLNMCYMGQLQQDFLATIAEYADKHPDNNPQEYPQHFLAYVAEEDRERLGASLRSLLDMGYVIAETTHPSQARKEFYNTDFLVYGMSAPAYFHLWAKKSTHKGKPCILGLLFNISERVFIEKLSVQREQTLTLGKMMDEIAHEFRNPIFAISGFARMLAKKYPTDSECIVLQQEAARLEQLIVRVQDYVAKRELAVTPCPMSTVIFLATNLVIDKLMGKKLHIVEETTEAPLVISDMGILIEILSAMLSAMSTVAQEGSRFVLKTQDVNGSCLFSVSTQLVSKKQLLFGSSPEFSFIPLSSSSNTPELAMAYKEARVINALLAVKHAEDKATCYLVIPAHYDEDIMQFRGQSLELDELLLAMVHHDEEKRAEKSKKKF